MVKYFARLEPVCCTAAASRDLAHLKVQTDRQGSAGLRKGKANVKLYDDCLCSR